MCSCSDQRESYSSPFSAATVWVPDIDSGCHTWYQVPMLCHFSGIQADFVCKKTGFAQRVADFLN